MNSNNNFPKALVQYPSKVKFFKKDNCKYQIQLLEDAKRVSEMYEVEYLVYQMPLSKRAYLGDNCPFSFACTVLILSWLILILATVGIGFIVYFV